jgi:hypothetical protein
MRLACLLVLLATPAFADKVTLAKNGALVLGGVPFPVVYEEDDGPANTVLSMISLGGKREGVLLVTQRHEGEDPPPHSQVFLVDGKQLVKIYDHEGNAIAFGKAGTGRYLEDVWAACERATAKKRNPKKAKLDLITLAFDAKQTKLVEKRAWSGKTVNCTELSACPFVYEVKDGEPQLVGEILRNIRYTPTLQGLPLADGGSATIHLTEEKLEVTFLDEIYLEVDGRRVAPIACGADPSLAYCAADGRYHVMTTGAVLPLRFEAPAGKRALFARGYYTPGGVADRNEAASR